jgi:hypothetical protein
VSDETFSQSVSVICRNRLVGLFRSSIRLAPWIGDATRETVSRFSNETRESIFRSPWLSPHASSRRFFKCSEKLYRESVPNKELAEVERISRVVREAVDLSGMNENIGGGGDVLLNRRNFSCPSVPILDASVLSRKTVFSIVFVS